MLHGEKLRIIKARVDAARAERKRMAPELADQVGEEQTILDTNHASLADDEKLAYSSPYERYHIAQSQRDHSNILNWVSS